MPSSATKDESVDWFARLLARTDLPPCRLVACIPGKTFDETMEAWANAPIISVPIAEIQKR